MESWLWFSKGSRDKQWHLPGIRVTLREDCTDRKNKIVSSHGLGSREFGIPFLRGYSPSICSYVASKMLHIGKPHNSHGCSVEMPVSAW